MESSSSYRPASTPFRNGLSSPNPKNLRNLARAPFTDPEASHLTRRSIPRMRVGREPCFKALDTTTAAAPSAAARSLEGASSSSSLSEIASSSRSNSTSLSKSPSASPCTSSSSSAGAASTTAAQSAILESAASVEKNPSPSLRSTPATCQTIEGSAMAALWAMAPSIHTAAFRKSAVVPFALALRQAWSPAPARHSALAAHSSSIARDAPALNRFASFLSSSSSVSTHWQIWRASLSAGVANALSFLSFSVSFSLTRLAALTAVLFVGSSWTQIFKSLKASSNASCCSLAAALR
mmetsp:Transcript_18883/g.53819  ORF Transcript_18883/g.53819 Transcript_18883/m.53819 type:complete len:295 (-) Transcript_18883:568-1452(-)